MLKGISCILVILFHCPIKGILGDGIIYALRFPIPIFFLSTGYYLYGKSNYTEKIKTYLRYLVFAEAVALISLLIKSLFTSSFDSIVSALSAALSLKTLFFGSVFNDTLWYLYAMIWTYLILFLLSKLRHGFAIGYASIAVLLSIHIAGRVFIMERYDINEWVFLFRSSLLFAVPFVLMGRYIAEKETQIRKYLNWYTIGGLFCFGMLLMVGEYLLWPRFMDLQVSTVFISIALFLFALYQPDFQMFGIFAYIGKNLLLYVYIFHVPVITILRTILARLGYENQNLTWLLVIVCTLVLSYSWVKLRTKLLSKRRKEQKQEK